MNVWQVVRFVLSAACVLGGLFVYISGVVGVFRFKYALSRAHAAAVMDTLGILLLTAGMFLARGVTIATGKMLVTMVFLWLSSPVASHLIARLEVTINDELEKDMAVEAEEAVRHEKDGD